MSKKREKAVGWASWNYYFHLIEKLHVESSRMGQLELPTTRKSEKWLNLPILFNSFPNRHWYVLAACLMRGSKSLVRADMVSLLLNYGAKLWASCGALLTQKTKAKKKFYVDSGTDSTQYARHIADKSGWRTDVLLSSVVVSPSSVGCHKSV